MYIHKIVDNILKKSNIKSVKKPAKSDPGASKRLSGFVKEKILQAGHRALYDYINSGEADGKKYHEHPTCKSRKVWFDLGNLAQPVFIFPQVYWKETLEFWQNYMRIVLFNSKKTLIK